MTIFEIIKSGVVYNDLQEELIKKREESTIKTNIYNASFGKNKEERETILAGMLKQIGKNVHQLRSQIFPRTERRYR